MPCRAWAKPASIKLRIRSVYLQSISAASVLTPCAVGMAKRIWTMAATFSPPLARRFSGVMLVIMERLLIVEKVFPMSKPFQIEVHSPEGNPVVLEHFETALPISAGQVVMAPGLGKDNHRAVVQRVTHLFLPDGGYKQMVYTAWEAVAP